jgi:phosphate-selective porin OprO/OprP
MAVQLFGRRLLDKRLDYKVGIFNGPRNSFDDLNHNNDLIAFLNARPFQDFESLWFLHFLTVGRSVAVGRQD